MHTSSVALLALGVAFTTAQAAKPQIQWNKDYDFGSVETFQWQDTDSPLETSNPFLHTKVIDDIEAQLRDAGLRKVDQEADVYVTYHTSVEQNVRLDSDSFGYGFGGYAGPGWGAWGYGYNGPISTTTNVVTYDTSTLIVDIVDADQNELVWRGSYARVFSEDAEKAEKQVEAALEAMAKRWRKLQD
jgi:hypothetical protein